jgi:hypothetical protein
MNRFIGQSPAVRRIQFKSTSVFTQALPESAARRNCETMGLALIELTDAWSVRERYILVRDREKLPPYARSLIETLCAHYRDHANSLSPAISGGK